MFGIGKKVDKIKDGMPLYAKILMEQKKRVKDKEQKKLLDVMVILASKDATEAVKPHNSVIARRLMKKIREVVCDDSNV